MKCLQENGNNARLCRDASKVYLECRMAKQLMLKEDFTRLGFQPSEQPSAAGSKSGQ
eukprot:m.62112 g.62112  ORF g.62112 m.62112 type:complete len:57 (+) comp8060_c0_seq4:600-770(+)